MHRHFILITYTTVGTNFLNEASQFYDNLLGLLGAKRVMDFDRGFAWAVAQDQPMFGLMTPFDEGGATIGNGSMVALSADDRKTVDKMHALALEMGGADEGGPADRGEGFYAAYFRDLDGNKLCVVCIDKPEEVSD